MKQIHVTVGALRERERERESRLLKTEKKAEKNPEKAKIYGTNETKIKVNKLYKGCKNVTFIKHVQELYFLGWLCHLRIC